MRTDYNVAYAKFLLLDLLLSFNTQIQPAMNLEKYSCILRLWTYVYELAFVFTTSKWPTTLELSTMVMKFGHEKPQLAFDFTKNLQNNLKSILTFFFSSHPSNWAWNMLRTGNAMFSINWDNVELKNVETQSLASKDNYKLYQLTN